MTKEQSEKADPLVKVRRRGAKATELILRTVLELGEELGFEALTVEAIAAQSGIAKTTIYRRWPNVSAILMDAFLFEVTKDAPILEKSTARESLSASMKLLVAVYDGRRGQTLRTVIGRAQTDSSLRHAVQERWVEPRRKLARAILQGGINRGELRPDLDADVILDTLYGAIYHRFLLPYNNSAMSAAFVEAVLEAVFCGITAKTPPC